MLRTLAIVLWSLWFGGIIALFIFVQTLFAALPRDRFVEAAPHLFFVFERYQLILAAVLVPMCVFWRGKYQTGLFSLLILAAVFCIVETTAITPHIEKLRIAGQTKTTAFKTAHGISMLIYVAEAIVLSIAGFILVRSAAPETIPAIAVA